MNAFDVALLVGKALAAAGVRYVLGGSLASTAFGEPRSTLDVDFAADLDASSLPIFLRELGPGFLVDEVWARSATQQRRSFQLMHEATLVRVDVFVPSWDGLHAWKWQHRRQLAIDDYMLDVTAPEGIVLQKLLWYRAGGEVSDRQWRDVLGVLKAQKGRLDQSALQEWSVRLGIQDLLERVTTEAGQQPDK